MKNLQKKHEQALFMLIALVLIALVLIALVLIIK